MNKLFFGALTGGVLAVGAAIAQPVTSASKPLEGQWQADGSQPITLTVLERYGNRLAALDVPGRQIQRLALRASMRGDSVYFDAQRANQHLALARSPDGQQLRGYLRDAAGRQALTLRYSALSEQAAKQLIARPPYQSQAVTVPGAGGTRLAGLLTLPEGQGPCATVLLLSDSGPDDRDARHGDYQLLGSLADYLARQGIAVLRLDDRGVGQSSGSPAATTLADRGADALAALAWLRTQPRVDGLRLGLLGHGEGGNVALQVAAQPLGPAFVVALAASGQPARELLAMQPLMYGKQLGADTTETARQRRLAAARRRAETEAQLMRKQGANAAQIETYLDQQRLRQKAADRKYLDANVKHQRAMLEIVRQTADNAQAQAILTNMLRQRYPGLAPADAQATVQTMTTPAYRAYLQLDPQPALAQVQCPVLLVNGLEDSEVPASPNLDLLLKGLKSNKQVAERRLPAVNHLFQAPAEEWMMVEGKPQPLVSPEMEEALRDWLLAVR